MKIGLFGGENSMNLSLPVVIKTFSKGLFKKRVFMKCDFTAVLDH